MTATPPRPSSPDGLVLPGHALQISPNLEALLEHDELIRRNSSPTTSTTAFSTEFPNSLPPPPPRKVHALRKTTQQDTPPSTARSKEGQRWKPLGSDVWLDALPTDGPASSRPATPNPYLNPAPVLLTQPHLDIGLASFPVRDPVPLNFVPDAGQITPKQADNRSFESSRSARSSPLDPSSCRPLNKVEKILWMGRDSLSLFSSSTSGKRNDSDHRNDEPSDLDAVQDRQMRQTPVPPSRPRSRLGDTDTATFSSTLGTPYLHALHQKPSETASIRSSIHSESDPAGEPQRSAYMLPRLSLPATMSYDSPRPQSVTSDDYLSFIDFFSPSPSDDSNFLNIQDDSRVFSSSRRQPHSISIPSPSLYSASHNYSSTSLASMRFAPPSPTSPAMQRLSPSDSSSSVAVSSMVFGSPSPAELVTPPWVQSFSGPPSPYSPLEFAQPSSPQDVDTPFVRATELASERGRKLKSIKRSLSLSPHPIHHHHHHSLLSHLPPTTNQLDPNQRADRIRRNRKLARVFGMVPGTDGSATDADVPSVCKKSRSPSLAALLTKQKNHRHAVSVSVSVKSPGMKTEPSTPWQTDRLWAPDGRRHSIPLATGSFTLYVDDEQDTKTTAQGPPQGPPRLDITSSPETASTRSFIDLSDDDVCEDDDVSGLSFLAPYPLRRRRLHQSTSTPSLVESIDSQAQAEADKRRKREKVAKLHRFLGSRVPPEAIIGNVYGPPLPPAVIPEETEHERPHRGHKNAPSDDFDRIKEDLDEKEKALNVRRAQKMERVFGTPPPQTLFHTRPSRTPVSQPTSPTNPYVLTLDIPSASRNPNQSAYMHKTHRRGPSDSSRSLLPRIEDSPQPSPSSFAQSFAESFSESFSGYQQVLDQSVYLNYQHSLNSLVDIIDRDDRRSLVELHCLLHGGVDESPMEEEEIRGHSRRVSISNSFKSERRHSLPSKSSMTSLSSEIHRSPMSPFQLRRRKAAKLTNFFGVDYRELIQDILESIEKGVEEERKQGTLQPEEVEVLMHRVRSLRTLRDLA